MTCCEDIGVNGVPTRPGGGGGSGGGRVPVEEETVWELDWSAQATEDYKAGGDGTYAIGGYQIEVVNTNEAVVFRNVNGTGLRIEPTSVFTPWGNLEPDACHLWFPMGSILAPGQFTSGLRWTFLWDFPSWDLPIVGNAICVKGVNTGTDFGGDAQFGGGLRRVNFTGGVPPTQYNGQVQAGSNTPSQTRMPQGENWNVLALTVWTRGGSVSLSGGPPEAYDDLTQLVPFGDMQFMGTGTVEAGNTFLNPFGGRLLWGMPTHSNTTTTAFSLLRRQKIVRGAL